MSDEAGIYLVQPRTVQIDYRVPLEDLAEEFRRRCMWGGWVDPNIRSENFPPPQTGVTNRETFILMPPIGGYLTVYEAGFVSTIFDCRPANVYELLSYGIQHHDSYFISTVALRSVWEKEDGKRYVPFLERQECTLRRPISEIWPKPTLFLLIKKMRM